MVTYFYTATAQIDIGSFQSIVTVVIFTINSKLTDPTSYCATALDQISANDRN
jgi:hypothetical protein